MRTLLPVTETGNTTFYVTPTQVRFVAWELLSMIQRLKKKKKICANPQLYYPDKYLQIFPRKCYQDQLKAQ